MSYYILSPNKQLCGYDKLPFGICDMRNLRTEFLSRETFALLLQCDGNTDIDIEALSPMERSFFEHNLNNKGILPCEKGAKLLPHQTYRHYDNQFKASVQ